jgi:Zn-dependent protease
VKLLLLFLSSLKIGKILTTGGTMLISVFAYSFIFGWPYAAGFVGLIFVHELGHYLAARQRGLNVGVPVFIPFIGAWIQLKEMPHNAETEAYVGLAGPLVGTIGALGCYYAARTMDSNLLLALSYSGFFLNLFNLIPVPPLDGGRVTSVISPRLWFVGIPVLIALFIYRPSPMLVIIAILALPTIWRTLRNKTDNAEDENLTYYKASLETRLMYAAYYIGLIIFLVLMSDSLHSMLASTRAGRGY